MIFSQSDELSSDTRSSSTRNTLINEPSGDLSPPTQSSLPLGWRNPTRFTRIRQAETPLMLDHEETSMPCYTIVAIMRC
jgi:hypothetical protein